jgi:hypothetical protein
MSQLQRRKLPPLFAQTALLLFSLSLTGERKKYTQIMFKLNYTQGNKTNRV